MDARGKSFIKGADTVGSEEEDARIVFQGAEEDCGALGLGGEGEGWKEEIPATRLLRSKFSVWRASRKTSASSIRRMQPHRLARAKFFSRRLSTTSAVDPRSPGWYKCHVRKLIGDGNCKPHVIWNRGFWK